MKSKVIAFFKKEVVLVVAAILAFISSFIVPPTSAYMGYIDWCVLGILLSLMIVMAGLQKNGLFDALVTLLLKRTKKVWQLAFVLVFLCFFLSMLITNDVALITFVPFAVLTLKKSGQERIVIPVVVLQTIAANLGSMLTPIGNPQNLYLYNLSQVGILEFMRCMLPYTIVSGLLLGISLLFIKGKQEAVVIKEETKIQVPLKKNIIYLVLFVLSLLSVAKILPYIVVLFLVLIVVFIMEKDVLKTVDYYLLLTFICFFIFTGNLENIPAIKGALQELVIGRELIISVFASQGISNVPAALLLSEFTDNYRTLLIGVNIGGLGTLIASMASLISYKIFSNNYNKLKGKYFIWFTVLNILYLLILMAVALIV
ncbi:SLC13 family permease [Acetivibrio mesophilus]|uniref:Citrate transporter n=1 Tax=Acetivibrio mesophilus TaxID=2487273 RepID=A0A4Q0I2C4_9FIRM|nr:SLC13 family permease [Acetivibrio mesophilus]ODM27922.1 citrate transporter [Clostridium sp. Bc-iso-3]RXE57847.1 citrate transporter [Acetivibrio mesophilus]HHV28218.1 citrate transporter [Clostridium sp.]